MSRPISPRACGTHRAYGASGKRSLAAEYIRRHRQVVAPSTIPPYFNKVILHGSGKGMWVKTINGKQALIADSDLGVSALGYGHPLLIEFWKANLHLLESADSPGRYWIAKDVSAGGKVYDELSQAVLAQKLIRLAFPDDPPEAHMVIFDLGGGPLAAKVYRLLLRMDFARYLCLRPYKAFHGRFEPALTHSNPGQEENALPSGIARDIYYPDTMVDVAQTLELLEMIPQKNVGSLWLEGIQGEGGINTAGFEPMSLLVDTLRERIPRIKIVFDEIQTFTRTGRWFSYEHYDVKPDIVLVAKALGGRFPISAAIVPRMRLPLGWHGGTYPGYPSAVIQAIVTLDIIEEEGLIENARLMGDYLKDRLHVMCENNGFMDTGDRPFLKRKGFGLMQGIEFRSEKDEAYPQWRDETLEALIEDYVFTTGAGVPKLNPTIRIMPALNVDKDTIDFLVEKLARAVKVGFERAEKKGKKS